MNYAKTILIAFSLLNYCLIHAQNAANDSIHSNVEKVYGKNFRTSEMTKGFIGISPELSSINYSRDHPNFGIRLNIDATFNLSQILGFKILLTGSQNTYKTVHSVPSPQPGNPYYHRTEYESETWKYNGILIGPSFSIPIMKENNWDISPLFGISGISRPDYSDPQSPFAMDINTNFSFKSKHRLAFRISGDLFLADKYHSNFGIVSTCLGLGVICRFF